MQPAPQITSSEQFSWETPYPSQRMPVLAANVVATSQPLAAQAGLRVMLDGGNAIDAAIAAAITLTVVEPTSNGIGGDLFAIVWDGTSLHGLNASGRSPAAWTPQRFARQNQMPRRGWDAVTVPGAVSGWVELSRRFGSLPFERLFEPAIHYAREGFAVSPITAAAWEASVAALSSFGDFLTTFGPKGRAPRAGERFSCADQARTLELIAQSRGEAFYRGELAKQIAAAAASAGGAMTREDLAAHQCDWVGTIATSYRGVELHEIPPNGQGLAALIALGILRHLPLADAPVDSADSLHLQIEAMKLAMADAHRYVADPAHMDLAAAVLLDDAYLAQRARLIDPQRAGDPQHGTLRSGGTVYLAAADAHGRMVSLIQSNFSGFGSGIVIPGTGIAMQNRGFGFSLEPGHPNQVAPRKRPFHTIIPAMVMRGGRALMSFGVMGGPMQPQGHVQMMTRIFDYAQNPQAASDAPRWRIAAGRELLLEQGFNPLTVEQLRSRGHDVRLAPPEEFGGGQFIYRIDDATCFGASDHRKDGQAVGF
jgi:gamma-glutamyltranspeptidase / glutathione hydrolase